MGIRPEDMATADYARIVGTAWEDSEPGAVLSTINVAVGLNDHLLPHRVVAIAGESGFDLASMPYLTEIFSDWTSSRKPEDQKSFSFQV